MSDFSDMLQGKLHGRPVRLKDQGARQLDLFSSLSERSPAASKTVPAAPEAAPANPPEPEMVLPPAGTPPDVAADVRAVLSESGQVRRVEASRPGEAEQPLRTGIYHRPRPSVASAIPPPAAPPPPKSSRKFLPLISGIREWFAGVEMNRRMISLVVVLAVLVALIAFWTACPRQGGADAGTTVDLKEPAPDSPPASTGGPAMASPTIAALAAPAPGPAPAAAAAPSAPAADWKVSGTAATQDGGTVLIRFTDPVFVSADRISVEGWRALKALAARLVMLDSGARVIVTGHTDNVPLSKPTPQFHDNADLAAARAKVAVEHLSQFARANKKLAFEPRTGALAEAPYPNDTPQNRRLNRTVTVQVIPAP